MALQDLADDLRCCHETLAKMGYLNELNNRGSLLSIIEKLPYHLKTRWLKEVDRIKTLSKRPPTIEDVTKSVVTAAEEFRDPVFGKIVQRGATKEPKPKDCQFWSPDFFIKEPSWKPKWQRSCKGNHTIKRPLSTLWSISSSPSL